MTALLERHKGLFQLFSVLPLAHMIAMLLAGEMYRKKYPPEDYTRLIEDPIVLLIGLGIAVLGIMTWLFLIVHAAKNKVFHAPLRVLWIVNLVLFQPFAMPVYFFRFVLNPLPELDKRNEMFQVLLWGGIFFTGSGMVAVYQFQYLLPYLGSGNTEG